MSEKKIDLIAQLLAKAESTTPEEAEALTAAAEKMMAKYLIDQATIDERRAKKGESSEKIIEERLEFNGAYRGEMIHLGSQVAAGLGSLRVLQSQWNKGKTFVLYLIGFESDVQQAKLLINSLQVQSAVAVRAWWRTEREIYAGVNAYEQEKARRSFVHGFGSGAGIRIKESRSTLVSESSKGTEMVLVSRKAKVNEYVDAKDLKQGRARTATGGDMAAVNGYHAGRQANTGDREVSQGKGIEQ
jgi:hypothetical protein